MPVLARELQTTPEMCEHELSMYSQMERGMCADAWLAMDAAAAHELLALVRELALCLEGHRGLDGFCSVDEAALDAAEGWVTP